MTSRRRAAVQLRAAQRVLDVLSSGDVDTRVLVSRPVGDARFDHHWRGQQEQGGGQARQSLPRSLPGRPEVVPKIRNVAVLTDDGSTATGS